MRKTNPLQSRKVIDWRGALVGSGLAIALTFVASTLAALIPVPALALLVAAAAFLGVGMLTLRLRPGTAPIASATGAAAATFVLSFFPILFSAETTQLLTRGQIAISVIVSILFEFSLTWIGARLMSQLDRERTPPGSAPHQDAPHSV